jgi:hypothetical protein
MDFETIFKKLNESLDARIQKLEGANQKTEKILYLLRDIKSGLHEEEEDSIVKKNVLPVQDVDAIKPEISGVISNIIEKPQSESLEDVLQRAKQIRESKKSKSQLKSHHVSRNIDNSSSKSNSSSNNTIINSNEVIKHETTKTGMKSNDSFQQQKSDIISPRLKAEARLDKIRERLFRLGSSKKSKLIPDIYRANTHSTVSSIHLNPLYIASYLHAKMSSENIRKSGRIQIDKNQAEEVLNYVVDGLNQQKQNFDVNYKDHFYLKSIDQYTSEDITILLQTWMAYQKSIHILMCLNQIRNTPKSDKKIENPALQLIESSYIHLQSLAYMTPFHFNRYVTATPKIFKRVGTKPWLTKIFEKVIQHNIRLQIFVEFIVETTLGQVYLRHCANEIKRCCENTLIESGNTNNSFDWRPALLFYRDLYNCLIHQAQDHTSCIIIEK